MAEQPKPEPYTATDEQLSPQPPSFATATVPTPAAPSATYQDMISPKDQRVYRVPTDKVKAFADYGYTVSKGAELSERQIRDTISDWTKGGEQFAVQTIGNAPGFRTAYAATHSPEESRAFSEQLDQYAQEHPYLNVGANVLGTGVELAALGAAAPAGIASALAGLGVGGAVAAGAASNAALGAIARFDDASIHHAFEPAGQEKTAWAAAASGKDVLQDAVLGAALPALGGIAGKTLGWLGKNLSSKGQQMLRDSLLRERAVRAAEKQGRYGDLIAKVDEVIEQAPRSAPDHIKARIQRYGQEIETIKRTLGPKATLFPNEANDLQLALQDVAGKNDQILTQVRRTGVLQEGEINLDGLQKLNNKIRESVTWSDYDVNRPQNDKYQELMGVVRDYMDRLLERHDSSFGGTTASQWKQAFKDYSDWQILSASINRRAAIPGKRMLFQDVVSKGLGGAVAGGAGALVVGKDPLAGALTGAGFAAGYGVIKGTKPGHYAIAAKRFGELFSHYDDKLTKAVMGGMYGIPQQLHARSQERSSDLHAALSAVNADPQKAFTNLRTHYSQAGIPDIQADDAANRHFAMMTDIAALQPKRSAGADLPTKSTGDLVQQRKLEGMYRTAQDPSYALSNPSKDNMAFAKKHFPNIVFQAQQAIIEQLQQNPDLPGSAKRYASRVLGRPVGNSTSPKFYQMISDARGKMAQAEQQASQGGPRQKKSISSQSSSDSGTRLDHLQAGD